MSDVSHAVASGAHRVDKHASSNQDPHAEHSVPMSTYYLIFVALMVLLVVTVIAAFIDLGEANMIVAMLIAAVKAALVILYFMHVKFASRLTKVFVAASFVWLAILFAMSFMDYISRDWLSNSRGWTDSPVKAAYDAGTKHHGHPEAAAESNTGGKHSDDPAAGEMKDGVAPAKTEDKAPLGKPGAG